MRKLFWLLLIGLCGGAANTATACNGRYDPNTAVAFIPCIAVGETHAYDVVLQGTGGANFVLTHSDEYRVFNPHVTSVRILLTPEPAAVVFGVYPNGCVSGYGRPTAVQSGNNIDIQVKARARTRTDIGCTMAIVPFAEAVSLAGVSNPSGRTYTVNGVTVVPRF